MARNGSGTAEKAVSDFVNGTTISETDMNTLIDDIIDMLSQSVSKDGQTVITGAIDMNGNEVILDVDGDTSLTADTDDQIDVRIAGADDFRFTANTFTALSGSSLATNTIAETTAGSGVTVDSVLLKDGGITLATGNAYNAILDEDDMASDSATALASQQSIKAYVDTQLATQDALAEVLAVGNSTDGTDIVVTAGDVITADTINETTAAAGVTIDSVLLKDGGITATGTTTTGNLAVTSAAAAVGSNGTGGIGASSTNGFQAIGQGSTNDFVVLNSGESIVLGVPTGTQDLFLNGALSVEDTTDTTSGSTGSIHTDGGLGVAKDLYVGVDATVVGTLAAGTTTITGNLGVGVSAAQKLHTQTTAANNYTRLTSVTSGDVRIEFDLTGRYYSWIETEDATGEIVFAALNTEQLRLSATGTTIAGTLDAGATTITGTITPSDDIEFSATAKGLRTASVGHTLILSADNDVTNLTLSGASGSELATFAGDIQMSKASGATISRDDTTGNLALAGGNASNNGGNILLYGGSHATLAGDTVFRNGSTAWLTHDASAGTATFAGDVTLSSGDLNIASPTVPASAGAAGTAGDIAWDTDYIYVCTATNTWKRSAIATW